MAVTQLSDVIIPTVYMSYDAVDSPELTAFFESGVVVRNPLIDEFANGGRIVHMPFWKDLDSTTEPNYSTSNPADVSVPEKTSADEMVARVSFMNKSYSAADLVVELAGSDPMQHIRNRFGTYWTRSWQRRIIAMSEGIKADNVANDNGDMVIDKSVALAENATDANLFSRKLFTSAVFTLGDHFGAITAISVHSFVYKRMVDNDDIEFIRDSAGNLTIPTYMGIRVIVDDGMKTVAAGAGFKFTSVLFGQGAIGYGEGNPRVPVEVFRIPSGGNGGGIEELYERKTQLLHAHGFSFLSAAVAGESPTNAEMANAANWNRLIDRKNIPLAFLTTNG